MFIIKYNTVTRHLYLSNRQGKFGSVVIASLSHTVTYRTIGCPNIYLKHAIRLDIFAQNLLGACSVMSVISVCACFLEQRVWIRHCSTLQWSCLEILWICMMCSICLSSLHTLREEGFVIKRLQCDTASVVSGTSFICHHTIN